MCVCACVCVHYKGLLANLLVQTSVYCNTRGKLVWLNNLINMFLVKLFDSTQSDLNFSHFVKNGREMWSDISIIFFLPGLLF